MGCKWAGRGGGGGREGAGAHARKQLGRGLCGIMSRWCSILFIAFLLAAVAADRLTVEFFSGATNCAAGAPSNTVTLEGNEVCTEAWGGKYAKMDQGSTCASMTFMMCEPFMGNNCGNCGTAHGDATSNQDLSNGVCNTNSDGAWSYSCDSSATSASLGAGVALLSAATAIHMVFM